MRSRRPAVIAIGLVGLVVLGFLVTRRVAKITEDVAVIDGKLAPGFLVTRKQVFGKPMIDFPLFGGSRFTYPRTEPRAANYRQLFANGNKASAFIVDESSTSFGAQELEIDGTLFKLSDSWFYPIPYVYGSETKTATFRIQEDRPKITLRLIPNGKTAPKPIVLEPKIGKHKVRLTLLSPISDSLPHRLTIEVLGAKPSQEYVVDFDLSFTIATVRCGKEPALIYMDPVTNDGIASIQISPITEEISTLNVSRKKAGTGEKVVITDSHGHEIIDATVDGNGYSSSGGWYCENGYFEWPEAGISGAPKIAYGSLGLEDLGSTLRSLKHGKHKVKFYPREEGEYGELQIHLPR